MRTVENLAAFASLLVTAGCGHVSVTDAGTGIRAAPRPADCRVEFFRTKAPERAYDELAALHWKGTASAGGAQESLRARACELGADAVIVTRDYVPYTQNTEGFMTGTAIKYRAAATAAEKLPAAWSPPRLNFIAPSSARPGRCRSVTAACMEQQLGCG